MTARKPLSAPVIAPDEALANHLMSAMDAATVASQKLKGDLACREGQYERDLLRLNAARDADIASLQIQIGQQDRIIEAADLAIVSLKEAAGNVFQIAAE